MRTSRLILAALGLAFSAAVPAAVDHNLSADPAGSRTESGLAPRAAAHKPSYVTIAPDANIVRVVVKLAEGTRARLSDRRIFSLTGKDLNKVNDIIRGKAAGQIKRLAIKAPEKVETEKSLLEQRAKIQLADMNNYLTISVSSAAEAQDLVNRLNALPEVEIAYAEPQPEPAVDIPPTTPDFSGTQDYLRPAPAGVDADYAKTVAGGYGSGVRIIDIEGNWKFDHEDLELPANRLVGGTPIADQAWLNHGTAVVGVMIGEENGYGITGIVPQANIGMVSIGDIGATQAILLALDSLGPGDIMLIELHSAGPRYNFQNRTDQLGYVCMEYWDANFDAIQLAWAKGIIVCEAAGNGAENFDDAIYENKFDTTFRNSHAIIIGAGAPPSGLYGSDRARLDFSNYGERVNVQGYGAGVVTAGYGGLFNGGGDERQFYTATFSGTSSASPIVTGAVGALQSIYKERYGGLVLDVDRMREVLVATGSEQTLNPSQHIGPRPNIRAADSALPQPPELSLAPLYFDTTVNSGTQITVPLTLINHSSEHALDYAIIAVDSGVGDFVGHWLTVANSSGSVPAQGQVAVDLLLNATVIPDRTTPYRGSVEISYGPQGGPLDQRAAVPVYMHVPCFDTTYAASRFSGPAFTWVDIKTIGSSIQSYSWYNPAVSQNILDDGTAGPVAIGFPFPFYDTTYSNVYVGVNGALSFTNTNVNVNGLFDPGVTIPGAPFSTFVSAFWNDLNMEPGIGGHGKVYYYRSPRKDSLVIEYYRVGNFNSAADTMTTFEVILTRSGNITFQYLSVGNTGMEQTALVGISGVDCSATPYLKNNAPPEHAIADSTGVVFDYAYIIWEMSGDVNGDGTVNVGDAIYIINYVFKGGPAPVSRKEADCNCDEAVNIGDAIMIVNYVFKGGPPPCMYQW